MFGASVMNGMLLWLDISRSACSRGSMIGGPLVGYVERGTSPWRSRGFRSAKQKLTRIHSAAVACCVAIKDTSAEVPTKRKYQDLHYTLELCWSHSESFFLIIGFFIFRLRSSHQRDKAFAVHDMTGFRVAMICKLNIL